MTDISVDKNQQNKSTTGQKIKAYVVGGCILSGAQLAGSGVSQLIMNKVSKTDEFAHSNEIKEAAEKIVKEQNLSDKIKMFFMTPENKEAILKEIGVPQKSGMPEFLDPIAQVVKGKNAFFLPQQNAILASEKKASHVFHELGHVMNRNNSNILKYMQSFRMALMALPSLLIFSGFSKDKENGEKGFVKKNAGLIAGAGMGVICAEEAMASKKGLEMAKKFLPNANLGKLAKQYGWMGATYALIAVAMGVGTQKAVNYIDNKVHKK
ncbi:MAG: hypothetical protein WCF95_02470 [bacterium]